MENLDQHQEQQKRPVFLTVLAVLSFITIGIGILSSLFSLIKGRLTVEELELLKSQYAEQVAALNEAGMHDFAALIEKLYVMQECINANFYVNAFATLLSLLIGLWGVIYMLKGLKKGFHLYIIYNLMSVLLVYISVPVSEVPSFITIVNLIFAGLFVFLYSRSLHWMK